MINIKALIIWLIVGAVVGWLAGMVVKGGTYGLISNIIVGVIGGLIAGWLFPPHRRCDRRLLYWRGHQRFHRGSYSVAHFANN